MDRTRAVEQDRRLLKEFENRLDTRQGAPELIALSAPFHSPPTLQDVQRVEEFLRDTGALTINMETRRWHDVDGETKDVTIARAANTHMWPMGTNYWVKDNTMIAYDLIQAGQAEGYKLLWSALTLMSSVTQLKRFREVITSPDPAVWDSQSRWPHIFFEIADNLNVSRPSGWSHKQIAWQALACRTLELIEAGLLEFEDLTEKHKEFLALIVPFLTKIQFWEHENSSCWEEITARRSSTFAWNIAVIRHLQKVAKEKRFSFLPATFEKYKKYLPAPFSNMTFESACKTLMGHGFEALLHQLPYEAPDYEPDNPRYRDADALLLYQLMTDMPQLMAQHFGKSDEWVQELEDQLLDQVRTLEDPVSGGIFRYKHDTYQREGYFRNAMVYDLKQLIGAPSGDASAEIHFTGRRKILNSGRQAAWIHPLWQLSWLMGRRFQETQKKRYLDLQIRYFARGLETVTKPGEVSLEQGEDEYMRIVDIPAYRITEAYLSDTVNGKEYTFPSPHTPLNWAVGEAIHALAMMKKSLDMSP